VTENEIIYGINSVIEYLKTDNPVDCVYISNSAQGFAISKVIGLAKDKNILIKKVDNQKLNSLSDSNNHQGVAALVAATEYVTIKDILDFAKSKEQAPFIVIAHEIEDHNNLGAIIRTAEAAGVHGVIIPKRHSASVSGVVNKTSAGAVSHMNIAKVTNTSMAIKELKDNGVWVFGADGGGQDYNSVNYSGAIALVIGSEGHGITRLVKENCDILVKIPMLGQINSLNASVAGGILIYKIVDTRL